MPKIQLEYNQELDAEMVYQFYQIMPDYILSSFPTLKNVEQSKIKKEIACLIEKYYEYGKVQVAGDMFFKENERKIATILEILSEIIEVKLPKNFTTSIIPCVCPISPRFLDNNSFMVPFYYEEKNQLRICAHELVHFLYFMKLKEIFPKISSDTFNSPHDNWKISEIIAPVVVNDKSIQNIIGIKDSLYPSWENFTLKNGKKIFPEFDAMYKKRDNFSEFVTESYKKFNEIKDKDKLTDKII